MTKEEFIAKVRNQANTLLKYVDMFEQGEITQEEMYEFLTEGFKKEEE